MKEGWPKRGSKKSGKASKKSGNAAAKKSTSKTSTKKKSSVGKTTAKKQRSKDSRASKKASKKAKREPRQLKDPQGGLTAAGRRAFKEKDGSNLKPGVKGPADTPEKLRRKGSFLRRHYATLRGPLVDDDGQPTRLALQAHAWGEPVPKTKAAAKKLAEKGAKLLERYERTKGESSKRKASKRKTSK